MLLYIGICDCKDQCASDSLCCRFYICALFRVCQSCLVFPFVSHFSFALFIIKVIGQLNLLIAQTITASLAFVVYVELLYCYQVSLLLNTYFILKLDNADEQAACIRRELQSRRKALDDGAAMRKVFRVKFYRTRECLHISVIWHNTAFKFSFP